MRTILTSLTAMWIAGTATTQISLPQRILYVIEGPGVSTWFSEPVQGGIGDVDQDGHADFISVQPHVAFTIYSGKTGTEIYKFEPAGPKGGLGQNGSICPGGDVNDDGYDDIFVGAAGSGPSGEGRAWVVSGAFIYNQTGNEVLYTFDGEATGGSNFTNPGWAGDVNGDGHDDILIGDADYDDGSTPGGGKAYLYSGKDGTLLYSRKGTQVDQHMGSSVYGCGDVNQDGFDDFAICSRGFDGTNGADVGFIEVISGLFVAASVIPEVLYDREGENAFDNMGGWFNNVMEGGVDIDKDGFTDLVVGAPGFDGPAGSGTGKAYVISGQYMAIRVGNEFAREMVGDVPGMALGTDINIAEDVNGDGYDDVIASGTSGLGLAVVWSGRDATEIFRVGGEPTSRVFGYRCDGAGDVNNDGYGDILVGDWDWAASAPPVRGTGRCYVISGKDLMLESYQHMHVASGPPTTQNFSLDAGSANANRNYLLLTSLGTGPTPLGPLSVPLSVDPWFTEAVALILSGNPFFTGWQGTLDTAGKANVSWTLPTNTNPVFVGITLWQAAVVWHPVGNIDVFDAASNAVPITLK